LPPRLHGEAHARLRRARRAREPSAHPSLDGIELGERSVSVFGALDGEHRTSNATEIRLDVPRPAAGIEPGVVPAPKRVVHVGVISREAWSEAGIRPPRLRNRVDRSRLAEDVGSEHREAIERQLGAHPRRDERDRRPITVPDKKRSFGAARLGEHGRAKLRLIVHVAQPARQCAGSERPYPRRP
jgi:hypothetical protein